MKSLPITACLLVLVLVAVLVPVVLAPATALTGFGAASWLCGNCQPGGNPVFCTACELALEVEIVNWIHAGMV